MIYIVYAFRESWRIFQFPPEEIWPLMEISFNLFLITIFFAILTLYSLQQKNQINIMGALITAILIYQLDANTMLIFTVWHILVLGNEDRKEV